MHKKLLLLTVLLMIVGVVAAASAQETIAIGDSITGNLNNSTATYVFAGKAGDSVIISLSSDDFDALLVVQDANGLEVGRDDDGGGGLNSLLTFSPAQDGTYSIIVGSFS